MYPESGLARMRARTAEIRNRLNEAEQILAVIDDSEDLDWRELRDLATAALAIKQAADDSHRYATMLSVAATDGDLAPLMGGRDR